MNLLISPEDAKELFDQQKAIPIDTRDPLFFSSGHIEGAVNIEDFFTYLAIKDNGGMEKLAEHFSALLSKNGISRDDHLVIYEETIDQGFGQSCRGYFILKFLGHEKVSVMHGGLINWNTKDLPLTKEVKKREECEYKAELNFEDVVGAQDVLIALSVDEIVVLDCRDTDEWRGVSSSPYGVNYAPRMGRLSPVKYINWLDFVDSSVTPHLFKSIDQIKEICARIGILQETPIYVYCFKGARASLVYVALKMAGFKTVKVYFESWNDWSRDPQLPIDDKVLS